LTKRRKLFIKYSLICIVAEFILVILFLTILKDYSIIFSILASLIAIFYGVFALKFWHKEKQKDEWFINKLSYVVFIGIVGLALSIVNIIDWLGK